MLKSYPTAANNALFYIEVLKSYNYAIHGHVMKNDIICDHWDKHKVDVLIANQIPGDSIL
jgi:hypothetical protein